MAYLPTAVIAPVATIPAGTLLPTNVVLDGTGSTSGSTSSDPGASGVSVTGFQWYLLDVPNGSTTAVLLNDTTDTCTLDGIDAVGSYRVGLVVTDDAGKQSIAGFAPLQANASGVVQTVVVTTAYAFVQAPASATVTVTVELTNTALVKPAQGDRGWFPTSYWPLMDEVDALRGDIDILLASPGGVLPYKTAWISPLAGSATADGTPGNPYNVTSAAAGGYGGPLHQAFVLLAVLVPANASQEMAPITIHMLPGVYAANDINFSTPSPITFVAHGICVWGSGSSTLNEMTWRRYISAKSFVWPVSAKQAMRIVPADTDSVFYLTGQIQLLDFSSGFHNALYLENVYFHTIDTASQTGACFLFLKNCTQRSTGDIILSPSSSLLEAEDTYFMSTVSLTVDGRITKAVRCRFAHNVVVDDANASDIGLIDCSFFGVRSWTGPSGSAKFDAVTLARFRAAAWTYAGGATERDVTFDSAFYEIEGGSGSAISNVATATQYTNTSDVFDFADDDLYLVRGEFTVGAVAVGDVADLSLYICDTANIVADGVKLASITVDAACSVIAKAEVRCTSTGNYLSYDAVFFKKGPTVPAEGVVDCEVDLAFAGITGVRFAWVLTPAGAGTWTAGSTATLNKTKIHRLIGKY